MKLDDLTVGLLIMMVMCFYYPLVTGNLLGYLLGLPFTGLGAFFLMYKPIEKWGKKK